MKEKELITLKSYSIVFLLFILIVTPYGVGRGIFFDGLTYSSIARNLAEGTGSLWMPHYTKTVFNTFYENLPLQFWLQALWFKLFGDRVWIERVYGIFIMLSTILVFMLMLKELEILDTNIQHKHRAFRLSWAGLLFICMPVIMYSALNNLLENTMIFFVMLSTYFAIKSFNTKYDYIFSILSGLSILCAFLSKSIPGVFPLIVYPVLWIVFKPKGWFKRWIYQTGSFIVILGFILIFIEPARFCIFTHLNEQVFRSIEGTRGVSKSRFLILEGFFQEFSAPFIVALIFSRFKKWNFNKISIFLLIIGMSGFLPLMISQKIARRYLIPCLPFFAGFIAYATASATYKTFQKRVFKVIYKFSIPLIIVAILISGVTSAGKIRKNKSQWRDVLPVWERLQKYKKRIIVSACGFDVKRDWTTHAFYQRHFKWSFGKGDYLLERVGSNCKIEIKKYKLLVDGPRIRLWKKKENFK